MEHNYPLRQFPLDVTVTTPEQDCGSTVLEQGQPEEQCDPVVERRTPVSKETQGKPVPNW